MTDDATRRLAWERLGGETVYECPGFDVVREHVRLPDGSETVYDSVSEPPAVVILPVTRSGEIVVIDEWRQAVERTNRGLPAGTIEPGEDPSEAAHRELEEETGYVADRLEPLVTVEPSNGIADSVHHHFLAEGCTDSGERALEANESIAVETCSLSELETAVLDDDLRDGRATIAVLAYAATRGAVG